MAEDKDDPTDGTGGLGGTGASDPTAAREERDGRSAAGSVPMSVRVGQGAVLLLAVLFGVFALVNSQPVDFSWVFGETQVQRDAAGAVTDGGVPLIVLLLVSFMLGAALGGWWTWQLVRSRRHDDERQG